MSNTKRLINRGAMWGRLLALLELSKQAIEAAQGTRFLLAADDQELMRMTNDQLIGLLQRAWQAKEIEVSGTPKRKRTRTNKPRRS